MVIPERKGWRVELSSVVNVKNCSPNPVKIGHNQVVPNCYPVLDVKPYAEACSVHIRNTVSTLKFKLSDLKLAVSITKKLTQQLSDLLEVFSTDYMDVGCTNTLSTLF